MSYLHALVDVTSRRAVMPYVGAGLGLFAGIERFHLAANRFAVPESLEVNHTGDRLSVEAHALLGIEFRLSGPLHGALEARWVQAGDGSFHAWGTPDNAEEQALLDEAYSILRWPDFNFTGLRVSAGVKW